MVNIDKTSEALANVPPKKSLVIRNRERAEIMVPQSIIETAKKMASLRYHLTTMFTVQR